MKKIIKLKESDLKNIVQKIISEQSMGGNDNEVVRKLEEFVNDKVKEKQNELLNQFKISINGQSMDDMTINFFGFGLDLEKTENRNRLVYNFQPKQMIDIGKISLSQFLPEIEGISDFKILMDRQPIVRKQLEEDTIDASVLTESGAVFTFDVFGEKNDKKILKSGNLLVNLGQEVPFGEFYKNNALYVRLNKGVYGALQSNALRIRLTEFFVKSPKIKYDAPKSDTVRTATITGTTPTPNIIEIKLNLVDVFVFDTTNFVDEKNAMLQIDNFVNKIKNGISIGKEGFVKHVMNWEPTIIGYASIDGDPNVKITGKFGACKSKSTRGEYDKCLSEYRAKTIADIINQKIAGTGITIKSTGAGQTTKFGPGWTKENPTTSEQTAPNRRFVLTNIPPFKTTAG